MHLLHNFEGNSEKYFSSDLVMFPEGKKRFRVVIFFKTVVSRQHATANIRCIRGLI